eukprot:1689334-Amphidinium_carterae.1
MCFNTIGVLGRATEAAVDAAEEDTYLTLFLFTPKRPLSAGGHAWMLWRDPGSLSVPKPKNSKCRKYIQLSSTARAAKVEVMRKLCCWCLHRIATDTPSCQPQARTERGVARVGENACAGTDIDLDAEEAELAKVTAKARDETWYSRRSNA